MPNKSLSKLISETENNIIDVLNKSQLAPEILELILKNMVSTVHTIIERQGSSITNPEDSEKEAS